jgi:hypothetical protein
MGTMDQVVVAAHGPNINREWVADVDEVMDSISTISTDMNVRECSNVRFGKMRAVPGIVDSDEVC